MLYLFGLLALFLVVVTISTAVTVWKTDRRLSILVLVLLVLFLAFEIGSMAEASWR